jgi:hypothetical protein
MFRTFGNTLSVLVSSWRVLRSENLMMFPLATGFSLLVVLTYVLLAFQYGGTFDRLSNGFDVLPADLIFLAFAYLGASFVVVYFSTALVAAVNYRSLGGTSDFRFGLEAANDRLGAIALWSAIAGTVGLVIKQLASSAGIFGRIGGWLAEMLSGWATFLVVPVMIVEGAPPLDAMRRSTELFKETWGRQLVGNFGFGLLYFALVGLAIVLAMALSLAGASTGIAVLLAMMLFALTVATVKCLEMVFIAALYNYASLGDVDRAFPESALRDAYVYKKAKGRFGSARHRAAV